MTIGPLSSLAALPMIDAEHHCLLLGHGSRDPQWLASFESVATAAMARLNWPQTQISCAYLELSPPSPLDRLAQLSALGVKSVSILPVFAGLGHHAAGQLTDLKRSAAARFPQLSIDWLPVVVDQPAWVDLISQLIAGRAR